MQEFPQLLLLLSPQPMLPATGIDSDVLINSPSWCPPSGHCNFSTSFAKYATSSIWYSRIVLAIQLNERLTCRTVGRFERKIRVPFILGKIAVRGPLSNKTLEVRIIAKTFVTVSPVTSLVGMFAFMTRANGVTFVITGTTDLREGVYFVLVIIIADGTITAISTFEGTVFAAETAIGTC